MGFIRSSALLALVLVASAQMFAFKAKAESKPVIRTGICETYEPECDRL